MRKLDTSNIVPGTERYALFSSRIHQDIMVDYAYQAKDSEGGGLFRVVARDLREAREQRDEWLRHQGKPEQITQQEFDNGLRGILKEMTGEQLLNLPGVYEIVSEEFNNDVISAWERGR